MQNSKNNPIQDTTDAPVTQNELLLSVIAGMEEKRLKQSENNVKIAKYFAIAVVFCVLIVCGTMLARDFYFEQEVTEEITEDVYVDSGIN